MTMVPPPLSRFKIFATCMMSRKGLGFGALECVFIAWPFERGMREPESVTKDVLPPRTMSAHRFPVKDSSEQDSQSDLGVILEASAGRWEWLCILGTLWKDK